MTGVTLTDRPTSVHIRCVIEVFGGVFVLSRCFLDFSVGVEDFVIGLSQVFSFSSSVIRDESPLSILVLCVLPELCSLLKWTYLTPAPSPVDDPGTTRVMQFRIYSRPDRVNILRVVLR